MTTDAYRALLSDCLVPDAGERVGVLFGMGTVAQRYAPLVNRDPRPDRFVTDPRELGRHVESARAEGCVPLARVHTHPGGARVPSPADRATLPNGWYEIIAAVRREGGAMRLVSLGAFDRRGRGVPLVLPAGSGGGTP